MDTLVVDDVDDVDVDPEDDVVVVVVTVVVGGIVGSVVELPQPVKSNSDSKIPALALMISWRGAQSHSKPASPSMLDFPRS